MRKHLTIVALAAICSATALTGFGQQDPNANVAPGGSTPNSMAGHSNVDLNNSSQAQPAPTNGMTGTNGNPAGTAMPAGTGTTDNSMAGMNMTGKVPMADSKDIQDALAGTVQAAVSKGDFSKVVSMLTEGDRNRIGDASGKNWTDLDGRIDEFRKDFQAKYGQDFDLSDKGSVVFNDQNVHIMPGMSTAGDSAKMASDKMMENPNTGAMINNGGQEGDAHAVNAAQNVGGTGNQLRGGDIKSDATKNDANRTDSNGRLVDPAFGKDTQSARQMGQATVTGVGGNPNLADDGKMDRDQKDMACVQLPADGPAAAATLQLDREGALVKSWKINIPDSVDGQKLHDNLLKELTAVDEDKANWPTDVNQAYTAVSHHILSALSQSGM